MNVKQRLEKVEQQLAVTAAEDAVMRIIIHEDGTSTIENPLPEKYSGPVKINVTILPDD